MTRPRATPPARKAISCRRTALPVSRSSVMRPSGDDLYHTGWMAQPAPGASAPDAIEDGFAPVEHALAREVLLDAPPRRRAERLPAGRIARQRDDRVRERRRV